MACALALLAGGAATASAAATITWARSGGIAGVRDRMTISPKRKVVLRTRTETRRRTLPRGEYARIVRLVGAARLSTLRPRYAPKLQVSDGFTTSVRYRSRTVTVLDGSDPPARLRRALAALSALAMSLAR